MLTSNSASSSKASVYELGEDIIDVTTGEEWVERVDVARHAVEIFGRYINLANQGYLFLAMHEG